MLVTGATQSVINPGVDVTPASSTRSGIPGSAVVHTFSVANTGNYTDTFTLQTSGNSWTVTAAATTAPIGPGASIAVPVTVTIPLIPLPDKVIATNSLTFKAISTARWHD